MKYKILAVFLLVLSGAYGQEALIPSLHLRPSVELDQATVTYIQEDDFGRIWLGTQSGIYVWNGISVESPIENASYITAIYAHDSLILFVDLESIHRYNIYNQQHRQIKLPKLDYWDSRVSDEGLSLYSADRKDSLGFDFALKKIAPSKASPERSLRFKDLSFIHKEDNTGHFLRNGDTLQSVPGFIIDFELFFDRYLFVSTQAGLYRYDLDSKALHRKEFLKGQRLERIYKDRNDHLWVGTADNGAYMFHASQIQNRYFKLPQRANAANNGWRFVKFNDRFYSCTTSGLVRIPLQNNPDGIEEVSKGMFTISALPFQGKLLVGTAQKGLFLLDENSRRQILFNEQEPLDNAIIQLLPHEDKVLVTTKWGLHWLNKQGRQILAKPFNINKGKTYAMNSLIQDGQIVSATTNGIQWYNLDFELIKSIQAQNLRVFSDVLSKENELLFTSMDYGLHQLSGDSLLSVQASDLRLLNLGHVGKDLYGIGLNGAFQMKEGNYLELKPENGFPIQEYSQGGMLIEEDSLYLGGYGGVYVYDHKTSYVPSLPQWLVRANGAIVPHESVLEFSFDQSLVELRATAILLSDQSRYELSVLIQGEWAPFKNGESMLRNLEYGRNEVRFRIRDKVSDESQDHQLILHRELPIWYKLWFQIGLLLVAALLVLGMVYLIRYLKTKKALRKASEEQKITQERLRISRELHDNIGARLSHIISSLDIEMYRSKGNDQLSSINAFARDTMSQLRETIWAVGDNAIFFSELKQRIEQYIGQAQKLSSQAIQFEDHSQADFELNATETINLFRIVQESINNAIKYSQASHLQVKIKGEAAHLRISISDNGIGFDPKESQRLGSGLKGLHSRAEEINARIEIEAAKGKGATISILWSK